MPLTVSLMFCILLFFLPLLFTYLYRLRLAQESSSRVLSMEERAVALACAISIDFDYFSRHSGGGGLCEWLPFYGHSHDPSPDTTSSSDVSVTDNVPSVPSSTSGGIGTGIGTGVPVMMPSDIFGGDKSSSNIPPSTSSGPSVGSSSPSPMSDSSPFLSDEEAGLGSDSSRDGFLEDDITGEEGSSVFGKIMEIFGDND